MAIVRMKHLSLIALASARDELVRDISRLGCVEISEPSESGEFPSGILKVGSVDTAETRTKLSRVKEALDAVGKYVPYKRGLFAGPRRVSEAEMFSPEFLAKASGMAERILAAEREIALNHTEENLLADRIAALRPWTGLDVPLCIESTKSMCVMLCTAPAAVKFDEVISAASCAETAEVFLSSSDRELHYFMLMCHASEEPLVNEAFRALGVNRVQFNDSDGTAAENIARLGGQRDDVVKKREELIRELSRLQDAHRVLENAVDAYSILLRRELACDRLRETEKTILLEGWFPEREEKSVRALLDAYGAACEIRDPEEDEEPPVLTYSMKLFSPFGIITNMYSPPAYRGIDPNPFMAMFFSLFFGIMLSDAAYGLLMIIAGVFVLAKCKENQGIRDVMIIVTMCGISTFIWGALFGGFFGDAIGSVYLMVTGEQFTTDLALWFNPLNDPILMMVFSFALGGVHIFAGMAIKAYMMIRDGHFWDAVFDIGFWWMVLGGLVFMLVGLMPLGAGISIAGVIGLILTQGRHEKKLLKKLTKGITSLYDITSYFGDILSYSRLLALNLATAVVASVMNTMGVMTGPVGFIIVFIIGHTFNLAINLIGSYVHTARLQYVEFFGKFYESGGSIFDPLDTRTKYTDIIKEEH